MTSNQSFRLSFKRERFDAWSPEETIIKANKKEIGRIVPTWVNGVSQRVFKIRLAVKNDKVDSCPFKWITLKAVLATEIEARDFLKEHWDALRQKYSIHFFEE